MNAAEIRAAVAVANVPVLLMSVFQMTDEEGDLARHFAAADRNLAGRTVSEGSIFECPELNVHFRGPCRLFESGFR